MKSILLSALLLSLATSTSLAADAVWPIAPLTAPTPPATPSTPSASRPAPPLPAAAIPQIEQHVSDPAQNSQDSPNHRTIQSPTSALPSKQAQNKLPPDTIQKGEAVTDKDSDDTSISTSAANKAYAQGNFLLARDIWQQLAEEGDSQAMNSLGLLYDRGQGVEPDAGRALHWFARSAKAGDAAGMSNYGRMLEQGRGTTANPAEAARWLDLAARKGRPEAQYNLGMLYEYGRGVAQSDKAAAAWYSRAAAARQASALARLGQFYRLGRGVEKDLARATLLLYAAAMQGHEVAILELENMAKEAPQHTAPVLFGQRLDDTNRAAMRTALKKAGVVVKRENDELICDLYDVQKAVPGAIEMALCYAPGETAPLGFAKIDYIAPDKDTAALILKMVEGRFGQPSAGEGDAARLWNLGTVIVATQYMPDHKQMSLMYMAPRVYHQTRQISRQP